MEEKALSELTPKQQRDRLLSSHKNSLLTIAKRLHLVRNEAIKFDVWELEDVILRELDLQQDLIKRLKARIKQLREEKGVLMQTSVFDLLRERN